jgi:hypothetical protein
VKDINQVTDQESFNAGRRGSFAGSSTDMEEFRRGQNTRQIDLENAKSANTSYGPKSRGGDGGGGALLLVLLALGPVVVVLSIPSLLSAWILRRAVRVPEGAPVPTRWRMFAAAFFTTLATGVPGAGLMLRVWTWLSPAQPTYPGNVNLAMMGMASLVLSLVIMILVGGLALKFSLRYCFPSFAGYLRACLASIPVGVIAMLFTAGAFAVIDANI